MKNNIILLGLILSSLTPLMAFSADDVIKFRKQGTASVEREHAQQTEKLIVPTSDSVITTDDTSSSGTAKGQSSLNTNSKLASDADINKSKRRLQFNPPQE